MDATSSTSTYIPPPSFLRRTLDHLSTKRCHKFTEEESQTANSVAVIALQRYLWEQSASQPCQSYNYDVTITDGVWRTKCSLHPSLNHLVHSNTLKTGSDVIIEQCSFVYDERRLFHGYISIEGLRCCTGKSLLLSHIRDVSSLPVLVKSDLERSTLLQRDVPLLLSRKHYLPLWNNEFQEGDVWASSISSSNPVLDVSRVALIMNLDSAFRSTCKPLPLLVRIIHKSRLRYYGKIDTKIDFPYQAYFEVADQSGIMSLVLWNELCPRFYNSLHVGTVLYLQDYALKKSYCSRSRPQMDQYRIKIFTSIEICLNARNPTSIVTLVPLKHVAPQWLLPDVSYRFTTRSAITTLPNNYACDVMGLVTFVGRVERIKSTGNTGPEKYWSYRWVHAVDGTSEHPFILELFASSQPEIFGNICPMNFLVCTQMRVRQVEGSLPYLTSSCETEIFITGYHQSQAYKKDPTVQRLIQWTKAQKDSLVLRKTAVGGHYCYPHAPRTFNPPVAVTSEQVPIVSLSDLKKEFETLQYREHKKVAIQCQIVAVRYVEKSSMSPPQEKEVAGMVTGEQTVSEVHDANDENVSAQRKRTKKTRNLEDSVNSVPAKRAHTEDEIDSQSEEQNLPSQNEGSSALYWESSAWAGQRQEVSAYWHHGALHEGSFTRNFDMDNQNALVRWCDLHPMRWTPEHSGDSLATAVCPGYYQVTILGINKEMAVDAAFLPIVHSKEPRAVGLPQGRHDNTMLSCLSSGFLCPLAEVTSDRGVASQQKPEDIVATTGELEDTHLVCVLDICHLGGEEVEVLISKVYKLTEVTHA
ncbi:RPA-related protein RADX isoform X2 [Corythoichthys intestinalis]|uniref:RPA-related protein RADX isoform X2 n=1 Tax=Corythoichthys intestinalis TaxID=161448 RepID=UPI0025A5660C|nr:RPA-related protein RADX isoform X2 [Corythoichthys intestinalis]